MHAGFQIQDDLCRSKERTRELRGKTRTTAGTHRTGMGLCIESESNQNGSVKPLIISQARRDIESKKNELKEARVARQHMEEYEVS